MGATLLSRYRKLYPQRVVGGVEPLRLEVFYHPASEGVYPLAVELLTDIHPLLILGGRPEVKGLPPRGGAGGGLSPSRWRCGDSTSSTAASAQEGTQGDYLFLRGVAARWGGIPLWAGSHTSSCVLIT